MRIEATVRGVPLAGVPAWARRCEELGFDGLWTTETNHDPYFPLVLAAEHTRRVELGTGVVLGLTRSPVVTAHQAWDLQELSQGRFVLGLGSQVKAHVERRFSMPFEHPAARMRELVLAIRAIWATWDGGPPLDFQGDFYRHTLMPPAFVPGPFRHGQPKILLAGVQERMVEATGEVADGLLGHPLQTPEYVREVILPALRRGAERAGRDPGELELSVAVFAATTDAEIEDVRRKVAFYATTPQYRGVLELHGWGAVGERLHALSRNGGWDEMPAQIDDEMLGALAAIGPPERIARTLVERYGGLATRLNFHAGDRADPESWAGIVAALRAELA
ncbi:MAG: TIGR03617 family F420-dependent LLM class oxidoreductase [Thermoleophilia bacterium]